MINMIRQLELYNTVWLYRLYNRVIAISCFPERNYMKFYF